ncbi:unnamed protein product [Oncorhynchus mykiss]|uniref:Transposase Tc1-like domain-containing protein n=1 Tax=Oncorhynchus mykiss TaxID=8022 RepID=A0A060XEZ0_ONCMY|nr:unnamed protein product [Oncorhynchus mykiss]
MFLYTFWFNNEIISRKKPLFQNHHKKARLRFATAHGDKDHTFWRNVLWSEETKIELFGHNDHSYVWRKKGKHHLKTSLKLGRKWVFQMDNRKQSQAYFQSCGKMA